MFRQEIGGEHEKIPETPREETAGKRLKKIFHQDDIFANIEEQSASSSLLMHPLRRSIFIHLCQNPCDHTRSIARKMGKSLSAVNWNLGRLLEKGYIESSKSDGRKIYWPTGMIERRDLRAVSLLRVHWSHRILKIIHEANGHVRQKDMVAFIGINQQNVDFWVEKLISAGILKKTANVSAPTYSLEPNFIRRVRHYDGRVGDFAGKTLGRLKKDGLLPKGFRLRGSRLTVEIRLPAGRTTIHLECNPMASARRYART